MKCVFIIPYFGEFKNYFELFLESCRLNPEFDWLLITDNSKKYNYPDNFKVIHKTFEEFRYLAKKKLNMDISLDRPYKLCDYKPAYGLICDEFIKKYDYWGHCDCDLLFGDLSPIMELLNQGYDKLFTGGHLTIYKNTTYINKIFMDDIENVGCLYKKVFSSSKIFGFDEVYFKVNVHSLFEQRGCKLYEQDKAYNASTNYRTFRRVAYNKESHSWIEESSRNDQIYWKDGKVYRLRWRNGNIERDEFIYVHLQMRRMKNGIEIKDIKGAIKIEPNSFRLISDLPKTKYEINKYKKIYVDKQAIRKILLNIRKILKREKSNKYVSPWEYSPYDD